MGMCDDFVECAACRAKPGSPTLCADCLRRRDEWLRKRNYVAPFGRRLGRGIMNAIFLRGGPTQKAPSDHSAEHMKRARAIAGSALRPSTLAAEFSTAKRRVTKDEVVEAIATALLPFVKKMENR